MFQQQVHIINNILMALDAIGIILGGYGAYSWVYYMKSGKFSMSTEVFVTSIIIVVLVNTYAMGKLNLYSDKKPTSYPLLPWFIFKAIVVDFVVLAGLVTIFKQVDYSRAFLLVFGIQSFVIIAVFRVLGRIYLNRVLTNGHNVRNILVVADSEKGRFVYTLMKQQLSFGHKIIGRLSVASENDDSSDSLGTLQDLQSVLRKYEIDEVIFALDADRSVNLLSHISICKKMGIMARILPALWDSCDKFLSIESCQDVPFLTVRVNNINATGLLYKRILDIIGGSIGTILFLISYPFVATAIKLDSSGPVIFKQKRIGRNGRIFCLYKFRSMYQNAEKVKEELIKQNQNQMKGPIFKLGDDPRVTRVGKWLRKTSVDEFPQFLNVLKGEMSLVGTRPPTPEEVDGYLLEHLKRISSKPGITGLWQVSGRNLITDFEKVVELDCQYLDNWRFFDDLKILLRTIFVVLRRKGAF